MNTWFLHSLLPHSNWGRWYGPWNGLVMLFWIFTSYFLPSPFHQPQWFPNYLPRYHQTSPQTCFIHPYLHLLHNNVIASTHLLTFQQNPSTTHPPNPTHHPDIHTPKLIPQFLPFPMDYHLIDLIIMLINKLWPPLFRKC